MKTLAAILAIAFVAFGVGTGHAQSLEIKSSEEGKRIVAELAEKLAKEREKLKTDLAAVRKYYATTINDLHREIATKLKEAAERAASQGAAKELRDLAVKLSQRQSSSLSPEEIREGLVGTRWLHDADRNKGNIHFRFNADGTITPSWHKQPSMWSVQPDGTVMMIFTKGRTIETMRVASDLQSGVGGGQTNWKYKRLK